MTARVPAHLTLLLVTALLILLTPAFGQKKKKDSPPPAPQTEVRPTPKMGGTIRDILVSIQGQQTNLGLLTKITGDYVVFESEGDTLMYPLSTLQVVKFLKVEEGEARKIEIRFLSKD
jgi:UDP-N-acetylmuramyl pentapeptide phosphotransferase/UDP-N-acetylglucosamine-1-phosphate transferase